MYLDLPEHIGVFLLTLIDSGMRLWEAMQLLKSDLDETAPRTAANIQAETIKTKTTRMTDLTTKASETLIDYFATRTDDDPQVFLFSPMTSLYHF